MNDLAKVPEIKWVTDEQKMWTEFTSDDRWKFIEDLSIDKDRVHRDRTRENINKDAMYLFDCRSGFHQRELSNLCDLCHD